MLAESRIFSNPSCANDINLLVGGTDRDIGGRGVEEEIYGEGQRGGGERTLGANNNRGGGAT